MSDDNHAVIRLNGIEVGVYRQGDDLIIFVNHGPLCVFRERVSLLPELSDGRALNAETLRRLGQTVRIDRH